MRARHLLLLAAAVVCGACSGTRPDTSRGAYHFVHEGQDYEIVSITPADGDGSNFLIARADGETVLRARDDEQDGELDVMLTGELTLEQANAIYAMGITEATSHGKRRVRVPSRLYELNRSGASYTVHTCMPVSGQVYNRFLILLDPRAEPYILLDRNADGTLDEVEQGAYDVEEGQDAYRMTLEQGQHSGRIERTGGRFIVQSKRA